MSLASLHLPVWRYRSQVFYSNQRTCFAGFGSTFDVCHDLSIDPFPISLLSLHFSILYTITNWIVLNNIESFYRSHFKSSWEKSITVWWSIGFYLFWWITLILSVRVGKKSIGRSYWSSRSSRKKPRRSRQASCPGYWTHWGESSTEAAKCPPGHCRWPKWRYLTSSLALWVTPFLLLKSP